MDTPSVSGVSMNTTTSSIPRELPNFVTFRYQGESAHVQLAASHEEAQDIAASSFPRSLVGVDPSWLRFSIAVRYKSTNERKEFPIPPESWFYVTSRLHPYRCIDIHVVPPPSPPSLPSSSSSSYRPLYPVTPPDNETPLYPESPRKNTVPFYSKPEVPSYPESPLPQGRAPPYPGTPPPTYPGAYEDKVSYPPHAPAGFGYGFGWSAGPSARPLYTRGPGTFGPYGGGLDDMADRRSIGWSINSNVGMTSPTFLSRNLSNPTTPPRLSAEPVVPTPSSSNGLGLFSSFRHKVFPSQLRGRSRRKRRNSHSVRFQDYEENEDLSDADITTTRRTSGARSYVPSLI